MIIFSAVYLCENSINPLLKLVFLTKYFSSKLLKVLYKNNNNNALLPKKYFSKMIKTELLKQNKRRYLSQKALHSHRLLLSKTISSYCLTALDEKKNNLKSLLFTD